MLEAKVDERTRELSRANRELAGALRDSQLAHESLKQAHLELKQAQSRMIQQARMASLGQTAAGVAHEINNPLAFVTNNLVILKREVNGLHDLLRLYQQAEQTLDLYQRELHVEDLRARREVDLPLRARESRQPARAVAMRPAANPEDRRGSSGLRASGRGGIQGSRLECRGQHDRPADAEPCRPASRSSSRRAWPHSPG